MPGFLEGREGVKWDLGFSSYIFTGKMVFGSLGLGITKFGNRTQIWANLGLRNGTSLASSKECIYCKQKHM